MTSPQNDTFKTSNTALAAYLISEGIESPEIEYNTDKRVFFIFQRNTPKIDELISKFDTARAVGNIVLFFNAYQNLLHRIKDSTPIRIYFAR
jgi:hypothetical protein